MKIGDKVILHGFIDGYSYETTGQTNFIIALETGEIVEVPIECVIKKDQVVKKDEITLKNIIRRINMLDENSKTYWLDTILNWFSLDFGLTKYKQGYEQGKLEGAWVGNQLKDADKIRQELNKPVIPQFVADWIEEGRKYCKDVSDLFDFDFTNEEIGNWFLQEKPFDLVARAWLDGYTVEKEKRYIVKIIGIQDYNSYLNYRKEDKVWTIESRMEIDEIRTHHTRKELEKAGFGWVLDCPGIEIEEVE